MCIAVVAVVPVALVLLRFWHNYFKLCTLVSHLLSSCLSLWSDDFPGMCCHIQLCHRCLRQTDHVWSLFLVKNREKLKCNKFLESEPRDVMSTPKDTALCVPVKSPSLPSATKLGRINRNLSFQRRWGLPVFHINFIKENYKPFALACLDACFIYESCKLCLM